MAREQQHWLIEPLLAAGLDLGDIRALVVRLACEAAADPGPGSAARLVDLVADRSPEVRAAWTEMIGRMLQLGRL